MDKVNLAEKFDLFHDTWSPKIVAELNGQQVKLAKVQGEFDWHRHELEDELFLVVEGELVIELRDGSVTLCPGELFVVPRGVEHRPIAKDLTHIVLFEPESTLNTGTDYTERTKTHLDKI